MVKSVDEAPVFDVEAVVTPPGINGEHQQNSVKFFNYRAGHATPQEGVEAHFRAREGFLQRTSGPRGRASPIVEIAARSAASIRSSLRLIRPPSRESLVFFAEEAARAEAGALVQLPFAGCSVWSRPSSRCGFGGWRWFGATSFVRLDGPCGSCEKSDMKIEHRLPSIVPA